MGDKPRVRLLPVTENMMASEEKKKKRKWSDSLAIPLPVFHFSSNDLSSDQ